MPGFKHTLAAMEPGTTRRTYGTAYWDGSRWWANVGGNLIDARWNMAIRVSQGLPIVVDITSDGQGQSTAAVPFAYGDQPMPGTGTASEVIPGGTATEIVFVGEDGVTYRTDQFIGEFNPGDPIYLNWDADKPTIMGRIGALAVVPTAPEPSTPTGPTRGETTAIAAASDTFWGPGGWGSYATSRNGGEDVYTGTWAGNTVTGAWFYGAPKPELPGKTIDRVQFKLPARLPGVGNYNADITIHLYAHTSGSRPGGDVARVAGPFDFVVPAGWGGGLIDLPLTFGPALVPGGGVSIAGGAYAGFASRLKDPESGKLIFDWTA